MKYQKNNIYAYIDRNCILPILLVCKDWYIGWKKSPTRQTIITTSLKKMCVNESMLNWLEQLYGFCKLDNMKLCDILAFLPRNDLLIWSQSLYGEQRYSLRPSTFYAAGKKGNIDTLNLLRNFNCSWNSHILKVTFQYGHFDAVKWLRSHHNPCLPRK